MKIIAVEIAATTAVLLVFIAIGGADAFSLTGHGRIVTVPTGKTSTSRVLHHRPTTTSTTAFGAPWTTGPSSRAMTPTITTTALNSATTSSSSADNKNSGDNALKKIVKSIDIPLLIYFGLWYAGNYFYKISNKRALMAAGGSAGFPLTIASLQLAIGSLYGIFLWVAPDARARPQLTLTELRSMLPLAFCYAAAHCASSFSYAGGSVSFAEIIKAAEPVFAAVLATVFYHRKISRNKWLCLPLITAGVALAAVKELDFAMVALVSGCFANLFAAVRANENKKFIESKPDLKKRMGCVGNQFALTSILGFLCTIPFLIIKEGSKFGEFITLVKTSPIVKINLIASSLWFYGYNELSTMTLKKTGAVTQSVANTAKRIIVIVGSALVFHESVNPLKALGCAIGIGGVFLYSCIDQLLPPASNSSDEVK